MNSNTMIMRHSQSLLPLPIPIPVPVPLPVRLERIASTQMQEEPEQDPSYSENLKKTTTIQASKPDLHN